MDRWTWWPSIPISTFDLSKADKVTFMTWWAAGFNLSSYHSPAPSDSRQLHVLGDPLAPSAFQLTTLYTPSDQNEWEIPSLPPTYATWWMVTVTSGRDLKRLIQMPSNLHACSVHTYVCSSLPPRCLRSRLYIELCRRWRRHCNLSNDRTIQGGHWAIGHFEMPYRTQT